MKSIFLASLLAFYTSVFATNGFLVAPTHVDIDLHHRFTQSFMVTNTGPNRIHIRIKPIFLTANSRSLNLGEPISKALSQHANLTPYMMVSPAAISLMPGEERDVRVSINPPPTLKDGGYRAHVLFHMMNLRREESRTLRRKGHQHMRLNLNILMEMAISVYGYKGASQAKLAATCVYRDHKLTLHITNHSPWRFVGDLNVTANGQSKKVHAIILRDSVENVVVKNIDKDPIYHINYQGQPHLGGQGNFSCSLA